MSLACKNPDDLVTCPYNPCHRLKRSRLPYHLIKCAKDHNWAVCPFNATHHVPPSHLSAHISGCPDKVTLERELVTRNTCVNTDLEPSNEYDLPEPSEDWDAECNPNRVPGYDPAKRMKEITVRNPHTLSSMRQQEKKRFYDELRRPKSTEGSIKDEESVDSDVDSVVSSLSRMRLPSEIGFVEKTTLPIPSCGLGRGRIAANIYSREEVKTPGSLKDDASLEKFLKLCKGRGVPVAPKIVSNTKTDTQQEQIRE